MRVSEGKEIRRTEQHQWTRLGLASSEGKTEKDETEKAALRRCFCEEIQEGRADREEKQLSRWNLIWWMKEASIGK